MQRELFLESHELLAKPLHLRGARGLGGGVGGGGAKPVVLSLRAHDLVMHPRSAQEVGLRVDAALRVRSVLVIGVDGGTGLAVGFVDLDQAFDLRAELVGQAVEQLEDREQQVGVGAERGAEAGDLLVVQDELERRVGAVGRCMRERRSEDLGPGEVAGEQGLLAVRVREDVLLDKNEHGHAHAAGTLIELVGCWQGACHV